MEPKQYRNNEEQKRVQVEPPKSGRKERRERRKQQRKNRKNSNP